MTPTPPREIDLLMGVAIHEAGHALTATELKIRTRKAHVQPIRGGAEGKVELSGNDCDAKPHEYGLVLVAGVQAIALWLHKVHGYDVRYSQSWGDDSGCDDLSEFRRLFGVGDLRTARREVTPLLMRNFHRLERGARMLHQRRSMAASKV
jgi:hypothetical protein